MMRKAGRQMATMGRHTPFYVGAVAAALVVPPVLWLAPAYGVEAPAIVFFLCYLVLTACRFPRLTADRLERHISEADEPVWSIFAVTLAAATASIASLFIVLNQKNTAPGLQIALAFAPVALGWMTIHVMAAMHYAHLYWSPSPHGGGAGKGLDFPQTERPAVYDFLYFSFVIGMTAQTSDVAITATAMRKVNLLHAIVSFFFNTVLVAAAVNTAVTLAT
ncbi:DUF1345 domain-containing protein [Shinella daejeonensis]|uniref:DUF1345 domain-containing protein n=1 Tax=Shinella daejeonensis TaxID=659017 RepID=UPI003F5CF1B3